MWSLGREGVREDGEWDGVCESKGSEATSERVDGWWA
jgi:hypothetical protein